MIESFLREKRELERDVEKLSAAIDDKHLLDDTPVEVSVFTRNHDYKCVRFEFSIVKKSMVEQLEKYQSRLDLINKKIDAIGALMGAAS